MRWLLLDVVPTGLLAGSLCMGTLGVRRAVAQLDDATALRVRHHLIRSLRLVMPLLMLLTVGSTFAVAVFGCNRARYPDVVAAGAALAVLVISISVHSPLNRRFLRWSPETVPANGPALIARWNRWDSIRAGFALLAFLAAVQGALLR
jgi:hypothetical protein